MAKRNKKNATLGSRNSARTGREEKDLANAQLESELDEATMLKLIARPNQIARDVRADYVASSEPNLNDFSTFQIPLTRHCPVAVIERFQAHKVMMPWFWKRDEAGQLTPCGFADKKWEDCSVTTMQRLQTRAYSFHKPVARVHGAWGGVARQWLHLSDECEHALRCVTNPPLFDQSDNRYCLGEDNPWQTESEDIPKLAANIPLGTILHFPARSVTAFYLPMPYEHEGKVVESYFTIGLSAAGHAVLFWATMHTRLRSMLGKLKDYRDRAVMQNAHRFIIESKPVLEWEQQDIDTLNAVRGEVLALDRYWDDFFTPSDQASAGSADGTLKPELKQSEDVTAQVDRNNAQSISTTSAFSPVTIAAMKTVARQVLDSKGDWSDSWQRVCKAAGVVVPRGMKNRELSRDEVMRCVNAVAKVVVFKGQDIAAAWIQKFVRGRS